MTTRRMFDVFAAAVVCAVLATGLQAAVISINFIGNAGAGGTLADSNTAGMADSQSGADTFTSHWNNAAGASGGLASVEVNNGMVSQTSVAWDAAEAWSVPNTASGNNILLSGGSAGDGLQNPVMMKGYIGATGSSAATDAVVTVSNLLPEVGMASYDVIVYFDGDNGGSWRKGVYAINGGTPQDGEDSENINFNSGGGNNANGLFQFPAPGPGGNSDWPNATNNDEGNFVRFNGLTASSFTLVATGGANNSVPRGPINGIQILGVRAVPEPTTLLIWSLLAGLGIGLGWRRKK